jgi:hypothetical protein
VTLSGIADAGYNALTRGKKTVTKRVLTFLGVSDQKSVPLAKYDLGSGKIRIRTRTIPK